MLTTGIIHSDYSKAHPVWWPQSRVQTYVRFSENLHGLDQTGFCFLHWLPVCWRGKPPLNWRCCDLIQPIPVMKMFAKSTWRRCTMSTRSQTWHYQKHVAVFSEAMGFLKIIDPYLERKLEKCSNRFEGCAPFLYFSFWWIAHPSNLRCWSASTKFLKLFKSKWRLNHFAFKLWSSDIFQSNLFILLTGWTNLPKLEMHWGQHQQTHSIFFFGTWRVTEKAY